MRRLKVLQILIDELIIDECRGIKGKHINYRMFVKEKAKSVYIKIVAISFIHIHIREIKENFVRRFVRIKEMQRNFLVRVWEKETLGMVKGRGIILMALDNIDMQRVNGDDLLKRYVKVINVKFA